MPQANLLRCRKHGHNLVLTDGGADRASRIGHGESEATTHHKGGVESTAEREEALRPGKHTGSISVTLERELGVLIGASHEETACSTWLSRRNKPPEPAREGHPVAVCGELPRATTCSNTNGLGRGHEEIFPCPNRSGQRLALQQPPREHGTQGIRPREKLGPRQPPAGGHVRVIHPRQTAHCSSARHAHQALP